MSTPHKPRKKKKVIHSMDSTGISFGSSVAKSAGKYHGPEFPLVSFLWPARRNISQWVLLPLILLATALFRWAIGLWGYSGFQVPPMHGDFEAQRHWMEITIHLPFSQWYFYDLQYWGLDYPPLTAYHSWLLGKIGSLWNPMWFTLDKSRGMEHADLKVFMRATVLISEYLIYVPSVISFNKIYGRFRAVNSWEGSIALVAILLQPATILIDHGHFQFNSVMLGFVSASLASVMADHALLGSACFVAALGFKQMALYFAPTIFAYLLGSCVYPRPNPIRLLFIAIVTMVSFATVLAPILLGSMYENLRNPPLLDDVPEPHLFNMLPFKLDRLHLFYASALQMTQIGHRVFPFGRGLFEDKVANVWCAIHTFHKLNQYSVPMLSRVSLATTIASISPASLLIFLFPQKKILLFSLASCAWGFFLCSFQVHEKSVLLPLLPMTLLLGGDGGLCPEMRAWIGWANLLATWTMFPLLQRDELRMPYFVLILLWAYLLGLPPTSFSLYSPQNSGLSLPTKLLHMAFYSIMAIWHIVEALVPPPEGKPDLWVVLNCIVGAIGFGICWLWCTWQLVARSGLLEWYFGIRIRIGQDISARKGPKLRSKKALKR